MKDYFFTQRKFTAKPSEEKKIADVSDEARFTLHFWRGKSTRMGSNDSKYFDLLCCVNLRFAIVRFQLASFADRHKKLSTRRAPIY